MPFWARGGNTFCTFSPGTRGSWRGFGDKFRKITENDEITVFKGFLNTRIEREPILAKTAILERINGYFTSKQPFIHPEMASNPYGWVPKVSKWPKYTNLLKIIVFSLTESPLFHGCFQHSGLLPPFRVYYRHSG